MTDEENKTGTEQTAVADDTNATPTTQNEEIAAESSAAQNDGLDELLKEFDSRKEATREEPARPSEAKDATADLDVNALAVLEKRLNDQEAREQRRELEKLFSDLSDGVQADAVDAEAYLNAMALRDPRLNQAYLNRNSNPKAWDKVKGTLKQDFQKRFGKKVDKVATESRNAVESAIRSASTAAPDRGLSPNDVKNMSKDDFDNLQRKLGVTPI